MKFSKRIIVIAVLLALATTYGLYYYINSIKSEVTKDNYIEVCVAKKDIPAKAVIDASMIETAQMDERYVLKDACRSSESIVGKYSMESIAEGEQIISDKIQDKSKIAFSYQIPEGKRALTIAVDEVSGVAYLLKPGDSVDVLVYVEQEEYDEKNSKVILPDIAKLFIQKALVLAVDRSETIGTETADGKVKAQAAAEKQKKITLAVSPSEAEKLLLGDQIGKLRLALRNPEETGNVDTTGAVRSDIVPERGKKVLGR